MRAFILAGGLGTRLRSIISDQPKHMADFEDKPFLAHQIEFLKAQGISHVILCVGYLYDHIMSYFGNGEAWDIQIDYSIETSPLGTGGAIKHAERFVDDAFLLLNGDTFFDIDLNQLIRFHRTRKEENKSSVGTLALTFALDASQYGSVMLDNHGRIITFAEKNKTAANTAETSTGLINAGIYVLEPTILEAIPTGQKMSLERNILPSFVGNTSRLYGHKQQAYFVDIGTPQGYYNFNEYIQGQKVKL